MLIHIVTSHLPCPKKDLLLTTAPEMGLQPQWSGVHTPLAEAVLFSGRISEGNLWEHVSRVVAVKGQVDLCAGLGKRTAPKQPGRGGQSKFLILQL